MCRCAWIAITPGATIAPVGQSSIQRTHEPQPSAAGPGVGAYRAVVTIEPIQASRKARVSELARMLGDSKAKSALAHAEELLGKG